jgi:hypothetical protein
MTEDMSRTNRPITWKGETLTPEEAASRTGLPLEMIHRRNQRGWTGEMMMTLPYKAGPHPEGYVDPSDRALSLAFLAIVAGAIIALLYACSSMGGDRSPCERTAEAFTMGNTFIERQLRSPSTADFPSILDAQITPLPRGDNCAFRIVTYVDAQNAFGGTVREHFALEVEPDAPGSDTWTLNSISTF